MCCQLVIAPASPRDQCITRCLTWVLDSLWEFYHTPKPCVMILRTECSLKCSKRGLACTMTQRHAINFPFVMQACHNPRNLRIWSCDQVESPNDRIDVLVNYC